MKKLTMVKIILLVLTGWLTFYYVTNKGDSSPRKQEIRANVDQSWKELESAQPILAKKYLDARDSYDDMRMESLSAEPLYQFAMIIFITLLVGLAFNLLKIR